MISTECGKRRNCGSFTETLKNHGLKKKLFAEHFNHVTLLQQQLN